MNKIITRGLGSSQMLITRGYGLSTDHFLTAFIGEYIRDVLRADETFLNYLGISSDEAKDKIIFSETLDIVKEFDNPFIIIVPDFSFSYELNYTEIYQGIESYFVHLWSDNISYSAMPDALDRIVTLFNKLEKLFVNDPYLNFNIGEFKCSGKISFPELDKINTIKGEINISLQIGGY